jgi:hypothetical protein
MFNKDSSSKYVLSRSFDLFFLLDLQNNLNYKLLLLAKTHVEFINVYFIPGNTKRLQIILEKLSWS